MEEEQIVFENKDTGALLLALGSGRMRYIGGHGTREISREELDQLRSTGKMFVIQLPAGEWVKTQNAQVITRARFTEMKAGRGCRTAVL